LFQNFFDSCLKQAKNTTFMTLNGPTDGITDFGITQAKHCNLASCSFVLQIDWSKTFSDGTRNNMRCKWLD